MTWYDTRRLSVRTAELFPPFSEYAVSIATVLNVCRNSMSRKIVLT